MSEKEYLHRSDFAITIIDRLKSMVAVIDVVSFELQDLNKYALDFYQKRNFAHFKEEFNCICDTFEYSPSQEYITNADIGSKWVLKILDETAIFKALVRGKVFRVQGYMIDERNAIVTLDDITQIEQQTKLLEAYNDLIDHTALVSKSDSNGFLIYANPAFCTIMEYTQDELIGRSFEMLIAPTAKQDTLLDIQHHLQTLQVWHGILENKTKSEKSLFLQTTITPILSKGKNGQEFLVIYDDITNLHNEQLDELYDGIEKALDINFKIIVDSIPIPSVIVDRESRLVSSNASFNELFCSFNCSLEYIHELFINEHGFVCVDPIFDWKDIAIDLSLSDIPRVLIDLNGVRTTYNLFIQRYEGSDYYVLCFVPTCASGI